jgi:hypothetical protein
MASLFRKLNDNDVDLRNMSAPATAKGCVWCEEKVGPGLSAAANIEVGPEMSGQQVADRRDDPIHHRVAAALS